MSSLRPHHSHPHPWEKFRHTQSPLARDSQAMPSVGDCEHLGEGRGLQVWWPEQQSGLDSSITGATLNRLYR